MVEHRMQHPEPTSLYRHIKEVLRNAGLRPRKRLGQNFLLDAGVLDAIVEAAELSSEDMVLEIGSGIGTLTQRLAASSGRLMAVELDEGFFGILKSVLQDKDNVTLVHGDILDLDISKLIDAERHFKPTPTRVKVIGNLPYYITTPILMKLLNRSFPLPIQMALVMLQEEVGKRIVASPGTKDYGALSIVIAYHSSAEILRRVPASSFYPQPKVDSVLVRLNMRSTPPVEVKDEQRFFQVVRAAFQHRRKTLRNALILARQPDETRLAKNSVDSALETLGLDPKRRGETLSIEEFAELANAVTENAS
jgi:16S rRNA (adenine1518-N6/adenine1519-N6)-dimethyltransferase